MQELSVVIEDEEPEPVTIPQPVQDLEITVEDEEPEPVEIPQPAEELSVEVRPSVEEDRPIVGGPTKISCTNGANAVCSAGTRDCYDDSPIYCDTPEPEPVQELEVVVEDEELEPVEIPQPLKELEVEVKEPETVSLPEPV